MSNTPSTSRIADITVPLRNYTRPEVKVGKGWAKTDSEKIWKKKHKSGFSTFPYFVGRKEVVRKLKDRLTAAPDKGASYLLVGARGAGKTTVVNKVVQELQMEEVDTYRSIDISLSNENFEEIDIYRIIGKRFTEVFLKYNTKRFSKFKLVEVIAYFLWGLSFLYLLGLVIRAFWTDLFVWTDIDLFNIFRLSAPYQYLIGSIILIWLIISVTSIVINSFWSGSVWSIRQRTKRLLQRIEADIVRTESAGLKGGKFPFNLGFQQSRKYPMADIRFIEHELISLLRLVNKKYRNQKFIFIFDELDKIESRQNLISEERSYEQPEEDNQTRRQQRAIIDILGNFKYFLNHAQAKFIFIAGSEMTDASMADISKRDFYLRSIFDEIITLDSLLKEDLKKIDLRITSAVEVYVYGIIIGEENFKNGNQDPLLKLKREEKSEFAFIEKKKKLLTRALSLKGDDVGKAIVQDFSNQPGVNLEKVALKVIEIINKEEIPKVAVNQNSKKEDKRTYRIDHYDENRYESFLRDFILYLTFRSHGSPRLLFQYFEKYIIPCDKERKQFKLKFDYKQQMVIGFVAHLYRGLVRSYYNTTVGHSDKLLSNLPFLVDHVLKFHDFAFSWRSLELLPEVIDVNKSPNLRKHITTVVDHFSKGHVKLIANGLFEYKFTQSTANEIRFASEISKTSRAAFNFTLDESLPLKKYYEQRIYKLKKDLPDNDPFGEYIHSLGFYYLVLGDLHFYDKQYDKAIENYNNAVQPFRQKTLNKHDQFKRIRSHEFIIYIRGMLRMNLTFERMKLYDSVFTYLEWTNRFVVNYFNLRRRGDYLRELRNADDFKQSNKFQLNNQQIFIDGFLNVLYIAEKASVQGVTQIDIKTSRKRFKTVTDQLFGGVTKGGEWWYFAMLKAHYNNQLGHLLFYKNGFLPGRPIKDKALAKEYQYKKSVDVDLSKLLFDDVREEFDINLDKNKNLPRFLNIPVSAYHKYFRCLYRLLKDCELNFREPADLGLNFRENETYLLKRYSDMLYSNKLLFPHNYQSNLFQWVANYLADFGNTILCLVREHEVSNYRLMEVLKNLNVDKDSPRAHSGMEELLKTGKITNDKACLFLMFSYLSGLYYKRINNQSDYAYALTRILYLIRYNATLHTKPLRRFQMEIIYEKLVYPALKASCSAARFADVHELLELTGYDDFMKRANRKMISRLVEYPELRDIIVVFFEIILASSETSGKKIQADIDRLIGWDWVNENAMLNNSFSRTMELRYKVSLNKVIFNRSKKQDTKKLINKIINQKHEPNLSELLDRELEFIYDLCKKQQGKTRNQKVTVDEVQIAISKLSENQLKAVVNNLKPSVLNSWLKDLRLMEQKEVKLLIADSLWCLRKIRTNLQVYGVSYITNHYFRAETSHTMADLTADVSSLGIEEEVKDLLSLEYKVTMDQDRMKEFMDPKYHHREAVKNYLSCIQLHSQGDCYYKTIRQMYYLEGDFDDQTSHFCASLDRYRINTGVIGKKIDACRT